MVITLYDSSQSPNCRKVRLLAAELGLPLELSPVSFLKGEHLAPAYLAKNPNGLLPTIDDGGIVVWESSAILKYLAAKRPEKGLVAADPKGQVQLDQWLIWWAVQPEQALLALGYERYVKPAMLKQPGNDPSIVAQAEGALKRFLPVLERQLEGREFILGGLSVVDFAAGPWLEIAPTLGVDLGAYPNIRAWLERLQAKPYWKAA